MPELLRIFCALTLAVLAHLFAWFSLPIFTQRTPMPAPVIEFEVELTQAEVPMPASVVPPHTRALPLTPKAVSDSPEAAPLSLPATISAPAALQSPAPTPLLSNDVHVDDVAAAAAAPPASVNPPALPVAPLALAQPRYDASYLNNPAPQYPLMARRSGLQGRVLLRVQVRSDGSSAAVEVKNSSGYAILDKAAQNTVLHWRFVPAKRGDEAVSAWVEVPIVFKLE